MRCVKWSPVDHATRLLPHDRSRELLNPPRCSLVTLPEALSPSVPATPSFSRTHRARPLLCGGVHRVHLPAQTNRPRTTLGGTFVRHIGCVFRQPVERGETVSPAIGIPMSAGNAKRLWGIYLLPLFPKRWTHGTSPFRCAPDLLSLWQSGVCCLNVNWCLRSCNGAYDVVRQPLHCVSLDSAG